MQSNEKVKIKKIRSFLSIFSHTCNYRSRRSKAAGFALKVLEDNFPKQAMGKMRDFYGWAKCGDSEHDLLKSIVNSFRR